MPRWTVHNPTRSAINLPYPLRGSVQPLRSIIIDTQAVNVDTSEMQALIRKGLLRVDVVVENPAVDDKIEVPVVAMTTGGLSFRGAWSSLTAYQVNDLVQQSGQSWVALQPSLSVDPITGPPNWIPLSESLVWQGAWSNLVQYNSNDVVTDAGSTWVALQPSLGIVPIAGPYWTLLTSGAGSGITVPQHEVLDTLVHELAETSNTENAYSMGRLVRTTVWTNPGRTVKIRESLFTYTGANLTASTTTQHDASGAVVATLSKTFTYSAGNLITVSTTRS